MPVPDWTDEDEKAYLAKCEKAKRTAALQRAHDLIDQVGTQSGRGQPHRNQTNLEEKARDFIKAVEAETFVKLKRLETDPD